MLPDCKTTFYNTAGVVLIRRLKHKDAGATHPDQRSSQGKMTDERCHVPEERRWREVCPARHEARRGANEMETAMLKKYVIERNIPKVGSLDHTQLSGVAANSNAALAKMDGKVEWVHSLVAADKTFCFYMAESAEDVRKHAQIAGIPANTVTEIETTIDGSWARP
jgi:uncharacterized protein DUF4242